MEEDSNKTVAAEISVNDNGGVYIGVKAKQSLGLFYNDNIEVTIPDIGRVIEGSLSSASQISTTQKTVSEVKEFGDKTSGATWHIEAIIEKVSNIVGTNGYVFHVCFCFSPIAMKPSID